MERVLIVGCGYVGLALGGELACQGHAVFGLRRSGSSEWLVPGITPLAADVTHPETLARLPGHFDWVVNCAASSGGSAEDYRCLYLEGNRNLLAWLGPRPPKKFLYVSSTSVYGQSDGSLVTEQSLTEPEAATARVLVDTEQLLLAAAREGFPAIILRAAGIYGPGRGHAFKQFLRGEAVLEGDGSRLLNMIHRDDLAGVIVAALMRGRPGEIYNAVDNEPVTQGRLYGWLAEKLARPVPPVVESGNARKRGTTHKQVSNAKLRTELGYAFKYPDFRAGYEEEIKRQKTR